MVIGSFFQDLDDEVGNGPAILRMHFGAAGGSRRCVVSQEFLFVAFDRFCPVCHQRRSAAAQQPGY